MSQLTLDAAARPQKSTFVDLYRAVWRWHFYAGLLVLPFLITLSLTGGMYLFRHTLDKAFHPTLKQVEVPLNASYVPPQVMVDAALAAQPGSALKIIMPMEKDLSAEITVSSKDAGKVAVYVNPYTGKVLGTLSDRSTVMWTVRYLHSLRYFGPTVRAIIEIVGGWMIILVATGIYLWWPRKDSGKPAFSVRGKPQQRMFWRDLHAVLGVSLGVIIVFLTITGMPWSGQWGAKVNEWANGHNFGYPSGVRVNVPMSDELLAAQAQTTWSLEQAKLPQSTERRVQNIGLNKAVEIFDALGVTAGYTVALPSKPTGVYTASVYPSDKSKQRVVHLDQFSGKPLLDMTYADYGPLGRWMEFGINVHMGQEWGLANQIVLLIACFAMILLSVSAGVMWWKRRPEREFGVPPMPSDNRAFTWVLVMIVIGGILFPLTGLSFLVMLAIDYLFVRKAQTAS